PIVVTGGPVTIPGHGIGNLSLLTAFDMTQPAGLFLLLNDARIQGTIWLNASYAAVIPVNLEVAFPYHWGAPFANLSYTTGTPFPGPNSTVEIPVTIHFENHTPGLKLAGNLTVTVTQPNGVVCTQQKFPVVTYNGPVTLFETFIVPNTCSPSGATISSVFTAPGINIPLPPETIP
ncbi:MAG: hypothetical protein L3J97_05155, partial [Thermoplasmata archaeon]|nr:hypothetical protein [Thermoplasmata archaeon]